MRRLIVCLVVVLFFFNSVSLSATTEVGKGDTLWAITGAKLGDPLLWGQVYARNTFLQEAGRMFVKPDGTVVVIIKPGEKLEGLDELGIKPTLVPFSEIRPAPTVMSAVTPFETEKVSFVPWWFWVVAVVLAVIGFLTWLFYQLRRDPVTSGPAFVEGGVTERNLQPSLQAAASSLYHSQTGQSFAGDSFEVLRSTIGRLSGVLNTEYADGRIEPRRFSGRDQDIGYEAVVRFPNRREETIYMLEACANPLRSGYITRYAPGAGFRFVPLTEAEVAERNARRAVAPATPIPAAASQPQPAVVTPVVEVPLTAQPAQAEAAPVASQSAQAEPEVEPDPYIELRFNMPDANNDSYLVEATGVEIRSLNFRQEGKKATFRFRPAELTA